METALQIASIAVQAHLKHLLGPVVFDSLRNFIEEEYLGEIGIHEAIAERPDLFERAFLSIFGKVGEILLTEVCHEVNRALGIKSDAQYTKSGDFTRYISSIPLHDLYPVVQYSADSDPQMEGKFRPGRHERSLNDGNNLIYTK